MPNKINIEIENEKIEEEELPQDYYEVIREFIFSYKWEENIIADDYEEEYEGIKFDYPIVCLDYREPVKKRMYFSKAITHKGKKYIVDLCVEKEKGQSLAKIINWSITRGKKEIKLQDRLDLGLDSFHLRDIFVYHYTPNLIIPPHEIYKDRISTSTQLRDYINDHEWRRINREAKKLSNGIYLMENNTFSPSYPQLKASFGTLLYQLISFRLSHKFDPKDLKELDELIFKVRDAELLKLQVSDYKYNNSEIGRSHYFYSRSTVENGRLMREQKALKECVKTLRRR